MQVDIIPSGSKRKNADALLIPYFQTKKKPTPACLASDLDGALLSLLEEDFKGDLGELNYSYTVQGVEKRVILLGLGNKESYDLPAARKAFATAVDFCRKKKVEVLNLLLPDPVDSAGVEAIVDALCMANYSFDEGKRETLVDKPSRFLQTVRLIGGKKKDRETVDRCLLLMESVNLTRNLVNRDADRTKASDLVRTALQITKKYPSVVCKVLGKKELEKEKMGLMLAVNRGSKEDPALIVLCYEGDPGSKEKVAVIGKGVTYDTGGLNLKPTGSMETMRIDMAGGAAVLGILQAVAALGIKKNVIGVIPAVENAIDADSYKPGDVYIGHSGKSVEITNTDAEGRLILADALSYVQKHFKPSRMIDLATLTGGVVVAIGEEATGLFCNDPKLTEDLKKAGEATGERVWQLPLYPEYLKAMKSTIADLKNSSSGRKASPCTGAIFLEQFVEKGTPWAHLDIAGTAYLSESNPYYPSYATGVGVKLLVSLLDN